MTYTNVTPREAAGQNLLILIAQGLTTADDERAVGEDAAADNTNHSVDELFDAYQWMMGKEPLPTDGEPKNEARAFIATRLAEKL